MSLVPLSTPFTVPTSCSTVRLGTYIATTTTQGSLSSVTQTFTATGLSAYGIVTGPAAGYISAFDPSCYPSDMSSVWTYGGFNGAYYPGACPEPWTTWSTHSVDGGWIATCCPRGLQILENYFSVCESYVFDTTTSVYDDQTPASQVPISAGTVAALPIYIMNYNPPSQGLSTGAKAGAGVAVAVGVLLVAALSFWLYWRRSRQKQAARPGIPELPEGDPGAGIKELGPGQGGTDGTKGLDGVQIITETTELEGSEETGHGPAEMTAEPPRAEFDGTGVSAAHTGAWELHGTAMVTELPPTAADERAIPAGSAQGETERETVALAHEDIQDRPRHPPAAGSSDPDAASHTGQSGQDMPTTGAPGSEASLAPSGVENDAESFSRTGLRREELLAELNRVRDKQARLQLEQLQRREQQLQEELNRTV